MNRLKELRIKYGLSLRKLQSYVGIDFSRLAVIEKTDANIETKTLEKLTTFFKVSDTYFFGRDGFIYYFDESNNKYFPMAYEQYKNILSDDVISTSIIDGSIRRLISLEGYERIERYDNSLSSAYSIRFTTERYIDFLNSLDSFNYKIQKEKILEYFKSKEVRRDKKKSNDL